MVTLHQGECEEVLKGIPSESVDMVFADPPFNVGIRYAGKSGDKREDYYAWCSEWIAECFRVLKPTGTFYLMTITRHLESLYPLMKRGGIFVNQINWRNVASTSDKRRFWNEYQPILMYGKTAGYKFNTYAQRRVIEQKNMRWGGYSTEPKGQLLDYWNDIPFVYAGSISHGEAILKAGTNEKAHPAQMPVGLASRCILFSTDEGDTVLDPFNGSGTTGAACLNLNRDFIGIEREQQYIEMARERWAQISLQASLFQPANKVLQPTADHAEVEHHSHQPGLL